VLLIPTFIVLGMTFSAKALPKVVVTLIVVSASFMVLEALNTPTYEWIFEIRDFYVNTRGFTEAAFWNKDSSLFVSATRPDGRFFSIVDLHRLSSVFLEPVGSETFCIAAWTFICACPSLMTPRLRICLAIVVLLMIVGTDGRLAFITSGFILIVCVLAPKLPRRLPFFYLPILTACVGAVVYAAGLSFTSDDFSGRLALSMHLLAEFDAIDLLGASNRLVPWAADSGLAYLILTQSIVGTIVIWGFITLGGRQDTASQTRYVHATSAWLSLFMMVSATFLTIKTAALLWFIYGSLQGDREN
jgi:putative polymerase